MAPTRAASTIGDPAGAYQTCFDTAPKDQLGMPASLEPFDPAFVFLAANGVDTAINTHIQLGGGDTTEVIALCYATGDPGSPTITFAKFAY
ncbi:hypothetical protein [Herbiconiux liangxiaofengii]|uniref:hypothetical protein n=1 Tax=Herbiconiux liangxiaofengii TaxID=3342795 RepID=UPI0035B96E8D